MKSTSTNVIGRIRHSVKTEPSILQCRNVLCHKDVRRTVDDQILEQPGDRGQPSLDRACRQPRLVVSSSTATDLDDEDGS
jgi:hypothetical protein